MVLKLVFVTSALVLSACVDNINPENGVQGAHHCDFDEKERIIRCEEQSYNTVIINGDVWIVENLNYSISPTSDYCYEDDAQYCEIFGRLYKANVIYEHICPEGFRLPKKEELIAALKGKGFDDINRNSGFHMLKPGMRGSNGKYYGTGKSATFWVDDDEEYEEGVDSTAYLVRVTDAEVNLELHDVHTSASIRCIRN